MATAQPGFGDPWMRTLLPRLWRPTLHMCISGTPGPCSVGQELDHPLYRLCLNCPSALLPVCHLSLMLSLWRAKKGCGVPVLIKKALKLSKDIKVNFSSLEQSACLRDESQFPALRVSPSSVICVAPVRGLCSDAHHRFNYKPIMHKCS